MTSKQLLSSKQERLLAPLLWQKEKALWLQDAAATKRFAAAFALYLLKHRAQQKVLWPCTIALVGDLGAGKTAFVQGFMQGLRQHPPTTTSGDDVLSPTYGLLHVYPTYWGSCYHMDCYRLSSENLLALGLDDYFFPEEGVSLVEWADLHYEMLPATTFWLKLEMVIEDNRQENITTPKKNNPSSGRLIYPYQIPDELWQSLCEQQ